METVSQKKIRIFRGEKSILNILNEYTHSGLSVKSFCDLNNIANATFHNWKKRYGKRKSGPDKQAGFASLQITPSVPSMEPFLFAEVKGIRIYQPVEAGYLKELLS